MNREVEKVKKGRKKKVFSLKTSSTYSTLRLKTLKFMMLRIPAPIGDCRLIKRCKRQDFRQNAEERLVGLFKRD
ncbi:hypothetical protein FACS1894200_00140 [Spirochaetia bacterium]|nr:hypothetical protein FACS1894200_00140 [Spirochaetia bacterium]